MAIYAFPGKLAKVVLISLVSVLGLAGCKEVDSSRIDCQLNDITVTSTLVGTVSSSGDMVTGALTINCDGVGVPDVTFTGSAGWWNLVSIGPSDTDGVIDVRKPAEALGRRDIGTTKTVKLRINAYDGGNEAERIFTILIPIS